MGHRFSSITDPSLEAIDLMIRWERQYPGFLDSLPGRLFYWRCNHDHTDIELKSIIEDVARYAWFDCTSCDERSSHPVEDQRGTTYQTTDLHRFDYRANHPSRWVVMAALQDMEWLERNVRETVRRAISENPTWVIRRPSAKIKKDGAFCFRFRIFAEPREAR